MSSMLTTTCPFCGLRFPGRPLLDLHMREDHRERNRPAEPGHDDLVAPGRPETARAARPGSDAGLAPGGGPYRVISDLAVLGYSDHTMGYAVALAAAARGARVIEKHFTLDRALPGPDHRASLEPEELAAMVAGTREIEAAFRRNAKLDTNQIGVQAEGSNVTLRGTLRSWAAREVAERVLEVVEAELLGLGNRCIRHAVHDTRYNSNPVKC